MIESVTTIYSLPKIGFHTHFFIGDSVVFEIQLCCISDTVRLQQVLFLKSFHFLSIDGHPEIEKKTNEKHVFVFVFVFVFVPIERWKTKQLE